MRSLGVLASVASVVLSLAARPAFAEAELWDGDCRYLLVGKNALTKIVEENPNAYVYQFVKDLPILGYRITSGKIADLPAVIRAELGAVDQTKYEEEYLEKNIGSVIALQTKDGKPDFYVVGLSTFQAKYREVTYEQFAAKNAKLVKQLQALPVSELLANNDPNLVPMLKTAPVSMRRVTAVLDSMDSSEQVRFESPWGVQIKPAGADGFIVFDESSSSYYLVNTDSRGLPIGYILNYPSGTQSKEFVKSAVGASGAPIHRFVKDLPILAYRITSPKFSDLPEAIRNALGTVDQTTYGDEYLAKNVGSVIALQMNGDKPDFYIIGKETFEKKYVDSSFAELEAKNAKLLTKFTASSAGSLWTNRDANLVALLKTAPVEMVRMSELGYPDYAEITIDSPWGTQTKPAGVDAYLTLDSSGVYYMINVDANGLPIGYLPTK